MAHVSEFKKKVVQDITKLGKEYPIIGVVNMENLPGPQLQSMRAELRGKVELFMTKKRLMKIALEKLKNEKNGIETLQDHFEGMPALIFTKDSPFKLSKILRKSKTKAPAKSGQTAPNDIIIRKGPTPFAPGPVISELSSIGLKVGVESGKVAVKEDSVVAKKGEKITAKVAEILTRLDIKPMEVGLALVAAYEDGIIYNKDVLDVDEKEYLDKVNLAYSQAFNLAFNTAYITNDNASLLIGKAFNDAKALGLSQNIFDEGIIEDLLGKAERSMSSLKQSANIETIEKPKGEVKEEQPTEPKVEIKKEKKKPEVKEKVEVKKPEIKKEEKPKEEVKEEKLAELKIDIITDEISKEEKKEDPKIIVDKEKLGDLDVVKEPSEEKLEQERERLEKLKEEDKQLLEKQKIAQEKQKFEGKGIEVIEKTEKTPSPKKEEPKQEDDIDKKVREMVEKTKKFMSGDEPSAEDIIQQVKKEDIEQEEKEVPSAQELLKNKQESKEGDIPTSYDLLKEKEERERKEVEELTKELLKRGTLRKK